MLLLTAGAARAATPTLEVTADATAGFGDSAHASVTIVGGSDPTGEITLSLYGPGDPTCEQGAAERTQEVAGPGPYDDGFMVLAEGTWKWRVSYSGDANNTAVTTTCGVAETVVGLAETEIVATATPTADLGQPISADAEVWGGIWPEGDLTFEAFGPGNASCSGAPAFSATVPVSEEELVTGSGDFTPGAPGEYRWVVTYGGDDIHQGSATTCGAEGLTSVITGSLPVPPPDEVPTCATEPAMAGCQPAPDPCQADPSLAQCRKAAKLTVGSAQPRSKRVKKGRAATIKVRVTNTGEAAATGVKACSTVSKKGFRAARKCVSLGSIEAGSAKVASVRVKTTKKARGKARVTVRVSSANAGGGSTSATIKARK